MHTPLKNRSYIVYINRAPDPATNNQIKTLVANAGEAALARSLGGPETDWLALAEAKEREQQGASLVPSRASVASNTSTALVLGGNSSVFIDGESEAEGGGREEGQGGGLLLTLEDLEEGEKRLPPPSSSMKMGCPKIPQVCIYTIVIGHTVNMKAFLNFGDISEEHAGWKRLYFVCVVYGEGSVCGLCRSFHAFLFFSVIIYGSRVARTTRLRLVQGASP